MVFGLDLIAIFVVKKMKKNNHIIINQKGTFALRNVMQHIGERLCHQRSNQLGGVGSAKEKHISDIARRIQSELLISRLADMPEKEEQKVAILLRNGKNYRDNINIIVPFVASIKNLPKTISFHYQKAVQIISRIFNPYAVIVTAKNGSTRLDYFNIYSNPELLKCERRL